METSGGGTLYRLEALRGNMANLSVDIEREAQRRRDEAAALLQQAGDEVLSMEQHVATESRRRSEAEQHMQEYAEKTFAIAGDAIDGALMRRLDVMFANAAAVEAKVSQLESDLEKQRAKDEKLVADLQRLTAQLTARVYEEVETERAERVEFEAGMLQKMRASVGSMHDRLMLQVQMRERAGATLTDAVRAVTDWSHRAADDKTKASIVAEINDMKIQIAALRAERYESEDNMADIMRQLIQEVNTAVGASKPRPKRR